MARKLRTGRSEAAAQRAFRRDLERDWERRFRAEHRAALDLQQQLEQQAKQQRRAKIAHARVKAAADVSKVKGRNVRRRERIRSAAHRKIEAAKRARREQRAYYREIREADRRMRKKARRRVKRRPKTEIDSRTEYNIDPELVPFWRTVRHRYPYSWTPDRQAEAFAEDMEADLAQELDAWRIEQELSMDWAAVEAAHYAEAVPF